MELSPDAQQFRALQDRLSKIEEFKGSTEYKHEFNMSDINRLKLALKPLVGEDEQGRFFMILNKMRNSAPISFMEAKIITDAFIAMADVIADDPALITRVRRSINDFNRDAEKDPEKQIEPDVEEPIKEPEQEEKPEEKDNIEYR